jgi:HD-GYP domain-containing protein (c-di-GMP phosphodiesterase class II)
MLHTLKIYTADLDIGMYVSGLDRPWLETPFVLQGFRIESQEDIERLREYCEYVLVDCRKSRQDALVLRRKVRSERARVPVHKIFRGRTISAYRDAAGWREEQPRARKALDTMVEDINEIFDQVSDGGKVNVIRLKKSVEPVIDSVSRNPDACLWVARLKQHDRYSYQHSLGASIWSVALGRQLGLPKRDLRSLAVGGLLMDVGKLRVDPALLRAERPLSDEERSEVRRHVVHGVEILRESGVINQDVMDMVAHHHERYDGSGYPRGLAGEEIPPMARVAAIVDAYDAITSNRSHASAESPYHAVKTLYHCRDREFQAELVEAFIQAVGIYPAGTLVELSSGEVGVVAAEYRTRRLRPKVLLILDSDKNRLSEPLVLDLLEVEEQRLEIARSLEPGAYGIDLATIDRFDDS